MAEQEVVNTCPVCGATELAPYIQSNQHQIVKCDGCDLLFVSPRLTEEAIKKMFVEDYIGTDKRVEEDFTSWRQASLKREAERVKKLRHSGGKLLDLGTASGAFLGEFVNSKNWHVEGVEPSRFAAKSAAERYKVPVYPGFLRDLNLSAASFDVVVSLDAFMFHPDPQSDLVEIARILKTGGLLAIEIPGLKFRLFKNSGALCRLIYGVPARLNAGVHLFYYSRKTLGQMVRQFGFEEIAAYPEQSPVYGPWYARAANWLYYLMTSGVYKLTGGRLGLVPKEFIVYRKVAN